jgi:hypothetical protein
LCSYLTHSSEFVFVFGRFSVDNATVQFRTLNFVISLCSQNCAGVGDVAHLMF